MRQSLGTNTLCFGGYDESSENRNNSVEKDHFAACFAVVLSIQLGHVCCGRLPCGVGFLYGPGDQKISISVRFHRRFRFPRQLPQFDPVRSDPNKQCFRFDSGGGLYTISRDVADTSIVPPGFHLRGSTRGNQVPNTEIQGVATDGDMGSSRIRIEGAPIDQPSTISRLLLNNVNIEISGAEDTRLANVAVTRVVLFNTNLEGPQVRLNHVEDFEVTESIFLRGADYGGKGLQTDNSTRGRISDNCFGGGINGAGSVVASGTNAGCPGEYFGARSVEGLASDQGHFITAWNASEGLTESSFENNWVEGNTNTTVNVAYRGTTPKVDHGIYIKFADDITIRENHFEGWPFEGEFAARGHLKVRNASKISILSNDIVGMHVDLRPSITPATTGWDIPGGWAHGNVLRQSCTMIADNLFEGGEVSYNGVRKDGEPGQITAQVMVTRNQFMPHSVYSARQGFRIRRGQRQLAMHTNDSFWIVRDDNTDGNGPVSFDITRWNRDGAGEVVASGTDRWGDECGW